MTEPLPPQQTPPPSPPPQSGWAQYQPQPATGWPAERGTPGSVIFVGILFILLSLLVGFIGAALLFAGAFLDQMPNLGMPITDPETGEVIDAEVALEMVQGVAVGIGAAILFVALGHLASGIGMLMRKGWARVLGIILAVIGVLIWGLLLLGSLAAMAQPDTGEVIGAVVVTAVVAVIYLLSFIVLVRRGDAFRRV
jgi:hypothetical protein